jgi:uncharacterized protein
MHKAALTLLGGGLLLCLLIAPMASAGPLEEATAAYDREEYGTALQLLRPLAEGGDPRAQYSLGNIYIRGNGVPQDYAEAMRWYRMAGEQGYGPAFTSLGDMYDAGQGVPRDYAEAMKWYDMAAEQREGGTPSKVRKAK